jgi:tRNA U55 pseudouridine synthase TruB
MTVETLQVTKLEEELSRIRITEFKEREAIQLNNELKRMQEQVRLALIAKALSSHQRLMLVQELLDGLYRQIEDLDHSGLKPETRKRMIEDREAIIRIFKAYRDAEGSRLLQTD